ncbi:MAG: FAD-binding protein [Jatrophihabitans sp.]
MSVSHDHGDPVSTDQWDETVDFLVAGSGAGGLSAALTAADAGLSTLVVEKGKRFGGTTALSGGNIWIPNNPTLRRAGITDEPEQVVRYLEKVTEGRVSPDRLAALTHAGPRLMALLDRSPWMRFYWVKGYSDYHPEYEGGRAAGRSIEALPFDTRHLGADEASQRPNTMAGPLGLWVTAKDYHDLAMVKRTWAGRRASLRAAWRVTSNLVRRRHMSTGGRALVARLRMALRDAGVPLWLRTALRELVIDADGAIVGVVVDREGSPVRIATRYGVLIATGGFESSEQMRGQYLRAGGQAIATAGARENVGDGIRLGADVGGALDLMDDAWWMPSVRHPSGMAVIPLVSERCIPGSVIVDGAARRFTNESGPYVNFVHDQLNGDHLPAWFVMDSRARSRYPFAQVLPGAPFPAGFYEKGIVHRADTLHELAASIGVPADALSATVERFNGFARRGVDAEFGRGNSVYDRYYGDPTLPNPNLDEITAPPFYAVALEVGDLGTKGGLVTDVNARVLRADGSVVRGLYATGNSSASVMGNDYAGAGATIGPAMAFGYLAAVHAATERALAPTGPDPG